MTISLAAFPTYDTNLTVEHISMGVGSEVQGGGIALPGFSYMVFFGLFFAIFRSFFSVGSPTLLEEA